jgi:hypothetical protein
VLVLPGTGSLDESIPLRLQLLDGFFGLARGCEAGDIRVHFTAAVPKVISVLARQGRSGSIEQYISGVSAGSEL